VTTCKSRDLRSNSRDASCRRSNNSAAPIAAWENGLITLDRRAALAALGAGWLAACGGIGGGIVADEPSSTPQSPSSSDSGATPAFDGDISYGRFAAASLGVGAALNGALPFPADNAWNTDISNAPVDPNSDALIASIGLATRLHPDFGAGLYNGAPIGIPYVVVSGAQPRVAMTWTAYGGESESGPFPIPANAPIEGGAAPTNTGDRHVLVIDRDNNRLYELFNATCNADGSWDAACGALFHLDSNSVRPAAQPGWTSADAAGLPIFPGLARYEEAALGPGGIRHALRFTVQRTRRAYVAPATHWASTNTDPAVAPMGMRVRLKAGYRIPASFSRETQALLTAMKTHGMIVADNGSNWYVSGAPDDRWNNDALVGEMRQVTGQDFEVVRMSGVVAG
jgi:hypothetical protein